MTQVMTRIKVSLLFVAVKNYVFRLYNLKMCGMCASMLFIVDHPTMKVIKKTLPGNLLQFAFEHAQSK